MATSVNAVPYTLSKIVTFRGMEGHGLNAALLKNGKAVAFILDEGCGGMMSFDFRNPGQTAQSFEAASTTWEAEEKAFAEFTARWYTDCGREAHDRTEWEGWNKQSNNPTPFSMSAESKMESWVNLLVDDFLFRRDVKRALAKRILFTKKTTAGCFQLKSMPKDALVRALADPKIKEKIRDCDEVLNLLPFDDACALYKSLAA